MAPDIIVFRNFCYFAILSLSFVYLYICTFFLAALAIDQKRIDAGRWSTSQCWLKMMMVATAQMKMMVATLLRDACCCCLKPERPDQPFGGCTILAR